MAEEEIKRKIKKNFDTNENIPKLKRCRESSDNREVHSERHLQGEKPRGLK